MINTTKGRSLVLFSAIAQSTAGVDCGVRFFIAGVVMLLGCALTGRRIWYSPQLIARSQRGGHIVEGTRSRCWAFAQPLRRSS